MVPSRMRVSRVPACVALLLACVLLLLAGCSAPWQHHPTSALGAHPTAQQLLTALQQNFRTVSSFHVVMRVQNSGKAASSQIQIRNADGDVLMPDKIKAQATVVLSGQPVTVNLVSIGKTQFITDPITGQWRVVKGFFDPRSLTNPDTGIVSLVGKLQHVTGPADDSINGVSCWRVNGQLDAKYIAFFTGGGVPAGTMLQTSVCIGKSDTLPYEVDVTGVAASGDTLQTDRAFLLSKFNESVNIKAPM